MLQKLRELGGEYYGDEAPVKAGIQQHKYNLER